MIIASKGNTPREATVTNQQEEMSMKIGLFSNHGKPLTNSLTLY